MKRSIFYYKYINITILHILIIIVMNIVVYSVSLGNGFVLDDEIIIVKNPQTLSLKSVPEVILSPDVIKPYYRPLNRATYVIDYQIFGLNNAWYHFVNISIHVGCAVLLYLFCRRFFQDYKVALITALLFSVHPTNSEAVNFVSARNTLLTTFFSLAALLAFLRSNDRKDHWPILAAFLFFCGLLCKESAFMLIAIIGLILVVPLFPRAELPVDNSFQNKLFSFTPFLFVTLVYLAMRAYSLKGLIASQSTDLGLFQRILQNIYIVPQYLQLLLFPINLSIYHIPKPSTGFFDIPGVVAAFWIVFMIVLWLLLRTGNHVVKFGMAWCVINYAPISNIIPIPTDAITERFLYFPAIGFFIIIGGLLYQYENKLFSKNVYYYLAMFIIFILAVLTFKRNLDWKSDLTLNYSAVKTDPTNSMAHSNLGTNLRDTGDMTGAVREWNKSIEIDPLNYFSLIQMATFFAKKGELQKAENYYLAALRVPKWKVESDKSIVYYNLGMIKEKKGQLSSALEYYEMFQKMVTLDFEEYRSDVEYRVGHLKSLLQHNK